MQRYDGSMKPWASAAAVVVVVTLAVLVTSPSWVFQGCNGAAGGSDCGGVHPVIVGFVGLGVSGVLLFVGALRSIR
jgi:hypothetical protein